MVTEDIGHHNLKQELLLEEFTLLPYAQKIGASGSPFFDDAVSEFFSPHAADKSTMIAVGVGVPGYKSRPGKILANWPDLEPK